MRLPRARRPCTFAARGGDTLRVRGSVGLRPRDGDTLRVRVRETEAPLELDHRARDAERPAPSAERVTPDA